MLLNDFVNTDWNIPEAFPDQTSISNYHDDSHDSKVCINSKTNKNILQTIIQTSKFMVRDHET